MDCYVSEQKIISTVILTLWFPNEIHEITKFICRILTDLQIFYVYLRQQKGWIFWGA